ncbi:MAG: hypothetical protein A2W31_10150 [Planctomycetes bacterium RBG_16_64_10]|nr:MAG: hypothetical protein A2W31_10150 [Planctomycetes bacterium RBG_16_64_10]
MLASPRHLPSLADLSTYVNETLCHQFQLERDVFPIRLRILLRGNRPCGVLFRIRGPGSLVLIAIWDIDTNAVLFYGPCGERFHKTQLLVAPELDRSGPKAAGIRA